MMVWPHRVGLGLVQPFGLDHTPIACAIWYGRIGKGYTAGNQVGINVTKWHGFRFRLRCRFWWLGLRRMVFGPWRNGRVVAHLQCRLEIIDHAALVRETP